MVKSMSTNARPPAASSWLPPRPILRAMLWELWRTSRLEFFLRTGGMGAMACLVLYAIHLKQDESGEALAAVGNGIILTMLVAPSLFNANWLQSFDNSQAGFQLRLGFTRPVTTTQLVMAPLLYTTILGAAGFLVPAVMVRLCCSSNFPLLAPAVVVGWGNGMFTATVWSARSRWMKAVLLIGLMAVCAGALCLHHQARTQGQPILLEMGKPSYVSLSAVHWAALAGSALIAFPLLVSAVQRQRCGEMPSRPTASASRKSRTTRTSRSFSGPFLAQLWYERRRLGWPIFAFMLSAPVLPFAFHAFASQDDQTHTPLVWLVVLGVCPLVYMLICSDGMLGLAKKQGVTGLSIFDATRPLRNDQMILAKLLMTALVSLSGWLWMLFVAISATVVLGGLEQWQSLYESLSDAALQLTWTWWLALFVGLVFTYCSSGALLLGFGMWSARYHTQLVTGMLVMYGHVMLAVWDYQADKAFAGGWSWYGFGAALALLAFNISLLVRAVTRRSLSPVVLCVFASLWGIQLVSTIIAWMHTPFTPPPAAAALAIAGCLTPLAAMAGAPLALGSFRHQ